MKSAHLAASALVAYSTLLAACSSAPTAASVEELSSPLATSAVGSSRQQLSGHRSEAIKRAPVVGRVPAATPIRLTFGLPMRNEAAFDAELAQISDPTSPKFRHYMTQEEVATKYGPSVADYEQVIAWAKSKNLEVTPHPERVFLKVRGAAADIEAALDVHLNYALRADGSQFYAPDAEPSLDLAVPIQHISNLDDFVVMRSAGGSAPNGAYIGNDLRDAYVAPSTLTGAGQSVGIFASIYSFVPGDIGTFNAKAGITPAAVQLRGTAPTSNGQQLEITLDIDAAQSMAPAAQIVVFNGSTDEIITDMTAATSINQFSSSFYPSIDTPPTGDVNLLSGLRLFAAHGQTFLSCSGDGGSYPANTWTNLNDVRAQPFVTVVGGTNLSLTGTTYGGESAWSGSSGGILSAPSDGGGGVQIPIYQMGLATAANKASPSYRNLPDVSAIGNGFGIVLNNVWTTVAGTSVATPTWGGFMALVNQEAQGSGLPTAGSMNAALYKLAQDSATAYATYFHDVTSGTTPAISNSSFYYSATPGYDLTTGLGTPTGALISALATYSAPAYASATANDRYWHDGSGNVLHQNGSGSVNEILAASGGYGASSSLASFAYPDGGQSVWFLDTLSPPHLRQIYVSPSGGVQPGDWGMAPSGCTWSGKPAVSSWGENRADVYENAICAGELHLFHQAWALQSFGWTDISPPGQEINSAPAVTTRATNSLDVIVLSANDEILYGSCAGACTGGGFAWHTPSGVMKPSGYVVWFGDVALASPSPDTLMAFNVDSHGTVDYSQWTTSSPAWTPSATWYAPSAPCTQEPGGPAVVRTGENSLFVACTSTAGTLNGGWGDTSLQGTWWYLASGVSGAPALTAH